MSETITLTLSTVAENHHGNDRTGKMKDGFKKSFYDSLSKSDHTRVITLTNEVPDAMISITNNFCTVDECAKITKVLKSLYWDQHMYDTLTSSVQNKNARSNTILCYPGGIEAKAKRPRQTKDIDEHNAMATEANKIEESFKHVRDFMGCVKSGKFPIVLTDDEKKNIDTYAELIKKIGKLRKGIEATNEANSKIKKLLDATKMDNLILQYPDYLRGKGTVYNIECLPEIMNLASKARAFCLENGYEFTKDAFAFEGNYYYDVKNCYIGFHGDAERKAVMGLRFGDAEMPLLFGVWKNSLLLENSLKCFSIPPGSAYTMSEKAAGTDWKKRSIITLRHAAGKLYALYNKKCLVKITEDVSEIINGNMMIFENDEEKKKITDEFKEMLESKKKR